MRGEAASQRVQSSGSGSTSRSMRRRSSASYETWSKSVQASFSTLIACASKLLKTRGSDVAFVLLPSPPPSPPPPPSAPHAHGARREVFACMRRGLSARGMYVGEGPRDCTTPATVQLEAASAKMRARTLPRTGLRASGAALAPPSPRKQWPTRRPHGQAGVVSAALRRPAPPAGATRSGHGAVRRAQPRVQAAATAGRRPAPAKRTPCTQMTPATTGARES